MINSEIAAYAMIGGVIPDALRMLKWARTAKGSRGPNPLSDAATYIALVIQVALGIFGASILAVTTPLQAAAVGYGAPDIVMRLLSNVRGPTGKTLGPTKRPLLTRLHDWLLS